MRGTDPELTHKQDWAPAYARLVCVAEGGQHLVENGLLLRTDVHRLFGAGYATVTPDYRFRVSGRLRDEFDNGEPYFPFHGQQI